MFAAAARPAGGDAARGLLLARVCFWRRATTVTGRNEYQTKTRLEQRMGFFAFTEEEVVEPTTPAVRCGDAWSISAQSPYGRLEILTADEDQSGISELKDQLACQVSGTPGSQFDGVFSRSGDAKSEYWPADLLVPTPYGGTVCLSRWLLMLHPPGTNPEDRVLPPLFDGANSQSQS